LQGGVEGPSDVSVDRPVETAWILRLEDWKGRVPSRKTTTTTMNWVTSLFVSILTGNDLTKETRHPCLVTFPTSITRMEESGLVRLGHLTDAVRRKKQNKQTTTATKTPQNVRILSSS
jgi:hypothetical protein